MKRKFLATLLLITACTFLFTGCSDIYSGKASDTATEATSTQTNAGQGSGTATSSGTSTADLAPDFTATLADGSTFTLSEHSGSVILLNFWATWCGPCVNEMPAFEQLNNEYGDEVFILAINCMEDENSVNSFIKENGYTFPIAYDVNGAVNYLYPSDAIPYTVVIGKDGTVQDSFVGAASAEVQYQEYKAAIDAALEK